MKKYAKNAVLHDVAGNGDSVPENAPTLPLAALARLAPPPLTSRAAMANEKRMKHATMSDDPRGHAWQSLPARNQPFWHLEHIRPVYPGRQATGAPPGHEDAGSHAKKAKLSALADQ
jgi:hypothetical protein